MKHIFYIFLMSLCISCFGNIDTHSAVKNPSVNTSTFLEEKLKTVSYEPVGLTMKIPIELVDESWLENLDASSGRYFSKEWKYGAKSEIKVELENSQKTITPEEALKNTYANLAKADKSEETKYLELDGKKGVFFRHPASVMGQYNAEMRWYTYLHYQGKLQTLQITIECEREEIDKFMQVFDSIKLNKTQIENYQNTIAAINTNEQLRTETLEPANLTIDVPTDLKVRVIKGSLSRGDKVTSTVYEKMSSESGRGGFDKYMTSIKVTNWDKVFPYSYTPEKMLEYSHKERLEFLKILPTDRKVEEVNDLEVSGLKGRFVFIKWNDQMEIIWEAFRFYKGTPQSININIVGKLADREKLLNVLKSAKFGKE